MVHLIATLRAVARVSAYLDDSGIIPVPDRESGLVFPIFARRLPDRRRVVHLDALHAAPHGGPRVRSLGNLAEVVLPTLKVMKGRIRVSCPATNWTR
jgi:hypothetical protein